MGKSRTIKLSLGQDTKPSFRQWKIKENHNIKRTLVPFYYSRSQFVPNLEAKSVVPELTRESEHYWWSLLPISVLNNRHLMACGFATIWSSAMKFPRDQEHVSIVRSGNFRFIKSNPSKSGIVLKHDFKQATLASFNPRCIMGWCKKISKSLIILKYT